MENFSTRYVNNGDTDPPKAQHLECIQPTITIAQGQTRVSVAITDSCSLNSTLTALYVSDSVLHSESKQELVAESY
jgi:hypothetical protein